SVRTAARRRWVAGRVADRQHADRNLRLIAEESVADSATSRADHFDDVAGRGSNVHDIGAIDPRMAAADTLFAASGDGDGRGHRSGCGPRASRFRTYRSRKS